MLQSYKCPSLGLTMTSLVDTNAKPQWLFVEKAKCIISMIKATVLQTCYYGVN